MKYVSYLVVAQKILNPFSDYFLKYYVLYIYTKRKNQLKFLDITLFRDTPIWEYFLKVVSALGN